MAHRALPGSAQDHREQGAWLRCPSFGASCCQRSHLSGSGLLTSLHASRAPSQGLAWLASFLPFLQLFHSCSSPGPQSLAFHPAYFPSSLLHSHTPGLSTPAQPLPLRAAPTPLLPPSQTASFKPLDLALLTDSSSMLLPHHTVPTLPNLH